MGLFHFFKHNGIDAGIEEFNQTEHAHLLDVRTPQEYWEGHIPGSENIPLQNLENVTAVAKNHDAPLFVYCHSGARSRQATALLQHMGYTNVKNIGGIISYSGKLNR